MRSTPIDIIDEQINKLEAESSKISKNEELTGRWNESTRRYSNCFELQQGHVRINR